MREKSFSRSPFPHRFRVGDEFLFIESKCRSVSVTNATYEGGGSENEIAFGFGAGAKSCRVQLGFLTMAQGSYFRRAIENLSNTIASRNDVIRLSAELDPADGELWLPANAQVPGRSGYMIHAASWIDAVFVTAEHGNAGFIDAEAVVAGRQPDLVARLTPERSHGEGR